MGKVIVTCDSTCDLTPELYQKYDIHVAPLYIRVRTHAASAEAPCRDCDR